MSTPEPAAGASVHRQMAGAYRAGLRAARARQGRRNPFDGNAADRLTRILSIMWARGYSYGNPMRL